MEYVITRSVLSFTQTIPLTREEYGRLREAKAGLVVALGIEEKFNIVRDNYAELEMELLRLGVEQTVFQEEDWGELVSEIYTINRRLLNLLSAARLYRDQIVRDISDVWGPGSSAVEQVREAREREEQESLPFRFMEALRNSIQHHSLPVYQLSRPMERDECKDGSIRIRHRADARIKWSHLAADKNFSAALRRELEPHAERDLIPLAPFVRGYVQSLGRIQKAVRAAISPKVAGWDALMQRAVEQAGAAFQNTTGLVVGCHYNDEEDELKCEAPPEQEDLFLDLIKRRTRLESRARHADMMPGERDYVSNE